MSKPTTSQRPVIVSIDGAIAVGKSTLCDALSAAGYFVFREGADDPERWGKSLERFYDNPKQNAFSLQIAILCDMQLMYKVFEYLNVDVVFVERSPLSARDIFLENSCRMGYINPVDKETYHLLHAHMGWEPDHIISLETIPEVAYERMCARGRTAENDVDIDYIRAIDAQYQHAVHKWRKDIEQDLLQVRTVYSIDATRDPSDIANMVLDWVQHITA